MEDNRVVTRFAIGLWILLGLPAVAAVFLGTFVPLAAWLLLPVGCLVLVLVEFLVFGPLMLLTAWLAGGGKKR